MADDSDETILSIDTSQYEAAINRVIAIHDKLNESASRAFKGLAVSVDVASGTVVKSLTEQSDAFTTVTSKVTEVDGKLTNFSQNIKKSITPFTTASEATKIYAIQLSKLAEAAGKEIKIPKASTLTRLDSSEIKTVDSAVQQLKETVKNTSLTTQQLRDDLNSLNRGSLFGNVSKELEPFQKIKQTLTGVIGGDQFKKDIINYVTDLKDLGAAKAHVLSTVPSNAARNLLSPEQQKSGSAAEISAVQKAAESKAKELERLQLSGVPKADIEKAFVQYGKGQYTDIPPILQKVIDLEIQLKKALEAVGNESLKASEKQKTFTEKSALIANKALQATAAKSLATQKATTIQANAPQAFADVEKAFGGIPAYANKFQAQKISAGFGEIAQSLAAGIISLKDLSEQQDIVNSKQIVAPSQNKNINELRANVVSLNRELTTLAEKEQLAAEKAAALARAQNISEFKKNYAQLKESTIQAAIPSIATNIQANFGPIPSIANANQVQKISSDYTDLARIVASGTVSFKELNEQLNIVRSGKAVPDHANEDINKVRKTLASLITDYDKLAIAEQNALDKSLSLAAATANKAAASAKATQLTQDTARIFPSVQTDITKSFGNLNPAANVTDIQRINVAMAELSRTIASGTVTYQQFLAQLDIVKNKRIVPPDSNEAVNQVRHNLSQLASAYEVATVRGNAYNRMVLTVAGSLHLFSNLLLYSAFSKITGAFAEGTKAASEFGTKIALIQTITQDQASTTNEWSASLIKLSDQLGKPVVEIAGAAYDTLSNQVTQNKEETERFLITAGNFARTVGATTPEAVNLLSTAIKGLSIDINKSEKIAAVFFGGIDYGRITAQGFNATLGRTVPLARDLKISLEELVAAQAALTQVGFGPEEAGTRLTNLLLGLEKPSEELKKFFKSFGADTGREFIQAVGGFQGAIEAISAGSKSGAINIEQLFPELRKLQAAFGLVNDGGKTFADILANITDKTQRYKEAQKITEGTNAFKFTKEINELKNTFVEFGIILQKTFVTLSDAVGGFATRFTQLLVVVKDAIVVFVAFHAGALVIESLVVTWGAFKVVLEGAAFAVFNLASAFETGTLAATLFSGAISVSVITLGGVATAAFAATTALLRYREIYKQAILDTASKQTALEVKVNTESFKFGINNLTKTIEEETNKWTTIYAQVGGRLTVILNTELEKQKEALKIVAKSTENTFKGVTDILQQGIHNIESAAKKASDSAAETAKNVEEIQRAAYDRNIDFQRDLARAQHEAAGGTGTGLKEEELVLRNINKLQEDSKKHAEEEAIDPLKVGQSKKDIQDAIRLLESLKTGYISAATAKHTLEFKPSEIKKDTGIQGILQDQLNFAKKAQQGDIYSSDYYSPTEETSKFEGTNNQNNQLYGNIYTWQQKINELNKQLINIENQQHTAQTKNAIKLQEIARTQKVALEDAIDAVKRLSEFTLVDKQTGKLKEQPKIEGKEPLSDKEFIEQEGKKALKTLDDVFDKLEKSKVSLVDLNAAGLKNRDDLKESIKSRLEEARIKAKEQLQGAYDIGTRAKEIKDIDILNAKEKERTEEVQKRIKFSEDEVLKQNANIQSSQKEAEDLTKSLSEGSNLKGLDKFQESLKQFKLKPQDIEKNAPALLKQIEELSNQSKIEEPTTPYDIISSIPKILRGGEKLGETVKESDQFVNIPKDLKTPGAIEGGFLRDPQIQVSQALFNIQKAIENIIKTQPQKEANQTNLVNSQNVLDRIGSQVDQLPNALRGTTTEFTNYAKAIAGNTTQIDSVMKNFTSVMQNATERLNSIQTQKAAPTTAPNIPNLESLPSVPQSAPQEDPYQAQTDYLESLPNKAIGGIVSYFSKGSSLFKPKGTDTIPAMLSPNEFVVSQKGTALFLNELQLMNKGINPYKGSEKVTNYYNKGGMANYYSEGSKNKILQNENKNINYYNKGGIVNYYSKGGTQMETINKISNYYDKNKNKDSQLLNNYYIKGGIINYYSEGGSYSTPKIYYGKEGTTNYYNNDSYSKINKSMNEFQSINKGINSYVVKNFDKGNMIKSFTPQLKATNYYNRGVNNSTTSHNTSIGDINVNVNDTSRNPNLGSTIGNQVRRELRRGILKPF